MKIPTNHFNYNTLRQSKHKYALAIKMHGRAYCSILEVSFHRLCIANHEHKYRDLNGVTYH